MLSRVKDLTRVDRTDAVARVVQTILLSRFTAWVVTNFRTVPRAAFAGAQDDKWLDRVRAENWELTTEN